MLDRPIVLLGAARSGTTLMGDRILGRHPALAYWKEPIFVWRYGAAYRGHDVRSAEDATPHVRAYIRRRLTHYVTAAGRSRLLEKTPSNCFRVPFIDAVLPEARFVHLVRDGRDVALSAAQEWRGLGREALDSPDLREGSAVSQIAVGVQRWARLRSRVDDVRSALELPAYGPRFAAYVARRMAHTTRLAWGPRPPGLRSIRRAHTLVDTCAIQWALSVQATQRGLADIDPARVLTVRYEALLADAAGETARILDYADLTYDASLLGRLTADVVARPSRWPHAYAPDALSRMESFVGGTLLSLGYDLTS